MKLLTVLLAGGALLLGLPLFAADPKPLATDTEKASYGVGMNVAKRFKHDLIELDIDAFIRGFRDILTDAKPALTEAEVEAALMKMRSSVEEKAAQAGAKNKKEGEDFLVKNKGEKGVATTPTGLQYTVIKEGAGPNPAAADQVKVHYKGTLLNGTEFDSSYRRNQPAVFPLNQVIPGWTEGIQKMKVGSHYKFWIPSELAYGENGQTPIPPHALLIFEVELLGIEPAPKP